MKVLYSWLRDFVDVTDSPAEIGRRLSLRGLALEGIDAAPPGDEPPGRAPIDGDAVLDFDVTANRPDCMSVVGIAREIAAVYGLPLRLPSADAPGHLRAAALTAVDQATFTVTLDAPELCPRYVGAAATVAVTSSPGWLQRRLTALGVRPISNVVDITNYVLLELGQPMHAFDHARLAGNAVVVRTARPGEVLTTLDGKARPLAPSMLVIADGARASAVGGVMGGLDSEVRGDTTRIVFESAWFTPGAVRATSKALALRSEASMRFERGADPTVQATAMARACGLLEFIGAGTADGTMVDRQARRFAPLVVPLSHGHVEDLLGMPVPVVEVERILDALGFAAAADATRPAWQVTVPGWRPDIARPEDLIEEVGRHHGFEHLPATFPPVHQAPPPSDPRIARDAAARRGMLALGFSEAISFAFVAEAAAAPFSGGAPPIALANPLSETFAVMRPSVLPGIVDAVSHNRRHGRRDVRLFEIATAFAADGERRSLAAAWTGAAGGDHWSGGRREVDFFDVKGVVEHLGAVLAVALDLAIVEPDYLVAGRAAGVFAGPRQVGVCGLLSPVIADARGIPRADDVYVLELNLDAIAATAPPGATRVVPLPRFPAVVRDVAFTVDPSLSAETLRDTIRQARVSEHLVDITLFDRFDPKHADGLISLAFRLTFQAPDRTLVDDEIHGAMVKVNAAAATRGATQR